jgi:hypothetical protein
VPYFYVIKVNAIVFALVRPDRPVIPNLAFPVNVPVQIPETFAVPKYMVVADIIPVEELTARPIEVELVVVSAKLTFEGKFIPFVNSTGPPPLTSVILFTRSTDIKPP